MTPFSTVLLLAVAALGQVNTDAFDVKQGAHVTGASATLDGFGPEGVIGGATTGEGNAGVTIFKDGGVNFVEFKTTAPVLVDGVDLYVRADDTTPMSPRSVDKFRFLADKDGDGTFEALLVDQASPINDGTSNKYRFNVVSAAAFRAEFISGRSAMGPRIIELDAAVAAGPAGAAGPAVVTIHDERIAAPIKSLADGKLVVGTDPERELAVDDVASVDLGNEPTLSAEWVGQDNHDLTQVGGAAGGNGIQDLHAKLHGLAAGKAIKQILVVALNPQVRGVWRLDTTRTPNWRLAIDRPSGATSADIYYENNGMDNFGFRHEVTITYDDGTTFKTHCEVTTHTSNELKIVAAPTADAPSGPPDVTIYGRDKTVLRGKLVELGEETLVLATRWGAELKLPTVALRGLAFEGVGSPTGRQQFEAKLAEPAAEDTAVVVGRDQAISQVTGTAHSLMAGKLGFTFEGQDRSINQARLVGLVFAAQPRKGSQAAPYQLVTLLSGDVLAGTWTSLNDAELTLDTTWGGKLALARATVGKIAFRNGKVAYLSDLEPETVEEVAYFGRLMNYRRDQALDGSPLKLANKPVAKGLAVHSRSVLTYALAGEYQSFKCLVGFDESARGRGRVVCRVLGDGKELFAESDLKATAEPKPIEVEIAGVKQLSLEVDFGAAEDTGDRVIWAEPRVFRADKK